ncbi:MAG: rhamnulokinase [Clostridia bacterium]|nr:rhamnulokinase [Clostridia bacterium]
MKYYLAIDIGASSGRHIVGWEDGGEIKTEEVYRFKNGVSKTDGHLVWNIDGLYNSVLNGIKAAFEKYKNIVSLAIDTWGVDYVLLNGDKEITPCYSYRDNRTEMVMGGVHSIIHFEELYSKTGIQFQPFNTIYQLYDDKISGRLDNATDFLMLPEYLTYKLTGVRSHEYTNATTTGLVNAVTGEYDKDIIKRLGLPERLFTPLTKTGTVVGELTPLIQAYCGGNCKVMLCASHDTASAVEGIPIEGDNPYISSGTWSLLGLKVPKAIADENSRRANYSNEGGVGYTRYQKNIMGMWVVNNLKAELCPDMPFDEIINAARESDFKQSADVNDSKFLSPESMKAAFDSCFEDKPRSIGDYFKCAFLSLAQSYKKALRELSANTGKTFDKLYIVGGGAKNTYLNELTEQICNIKVVALPIEATAIGNLKIQMDNTAV